MVAADVTARRPEDAPDIPPPDAGRDRRLWWAALAGIAVVGLAVRLVYVLTGDYDPAATDAGWYLSAANHLADGRGFIDPLRYRLDGTSMPGAAHPPGYTVVMAVPSLLGATGLVAHQIWSALIGTGTVVVTALAARRLGGPTVGLVAGALAAVYPWFWMHDGTLMSENLGMLLAATVLLLSFRFRDGPSGRRAAAVGLVCGLLALTRTETVLLLVFLAVPLAWVPGEGWRRRLGWYATIAGTAALTMLPWVAYNLSRYDEPVYVATGDNTLLVGNCGGVYEGPHIGWWSFGCVTGAVCPEPPDTGRGKDPCIPPVEPDDDESELGVHLRRVALHNVRENAGRMPVVVLAREGRTWSLFRPGGQLELDAYVTGVDDAVLWSGLVSYYALAVAFVGGVVVLRRRGRPLFPLVAFMATVAVAVAVVFGETRYRAIAEVPLVIGAAVGLTAAWRRWGPSLKRLRG